MSRKIQFSAIIDGVMKKKDGTLSIKLGTQELSSTDTAEIFELGNNQIWIAMSETEIETLEVPEVIPEMKGEKSPSHRMKAIIYKIWELKTDQKETFPRYYESYMFKICEQLKNKLD